MSDIDELRNRMDQITIDMLILLKERTDIARQIGQVKKSIGKGITDEKREDNLREKVAALSGKIGLDPDAASKLLNFLLNESVRVQSGHVRSHLSIFRKAKSLEQAGRKIIHMEVGEPDFAPPDGTGMALMQAFDKGLFKYGDVLGMPEFRDALSGHVSEKFGAGISRDNILVSPGARFSVFAAISTLLNMGDELIIIEPAWPAYRDCAMHAGVKVRTIPTTLENGWEPSLHDIENAINPNSKMIVLNYPNNPTGKILPKHLQDGIMQLAARHGLYVLSDEIYSDYAYTDWKSVLSYNYEKSIITQSFSKSHAMTGFRIGYAVASTDIIGTMSGINALCLTSVPEPVQYAAMRSLAADTTHNARTVRQRLDRLAGRARAMDLDFISPDGAMYLYARIGQQGLDGVSLADRLLEKGLAIAPGEGFGNYRDFIRISACQNENTLMRGMDILGEGLRE